MKKVILIISGIFILFSQPVLAAEKPFTIEVSDQISISEHKVEAVGNVVVDLQQEGTIKADRLEVWLDKKLITAEGNVVLIQADREVRGTSLEYDYHQQQGKIRDSMTKESGITFKGSEITVKPETLELTDTSLTPCIHEDPHYKLTAQKVTVYPGDKLVATGVWFWIKSVKVLPLFTYKMELKEEDKDELEGKEDSETFLEPNIGYNSTDGLFGAATYHHYINDAARGTIYGKYAEQKTHRFKVDYTINPADYLNFNPRFDYQRQYGGWDYYTYLKNEVGPLTSKLNYSSFIEKDEDDAHYKKRKWKANYDLTGVWDNFKADLNLNRPEGLVDTEKKIEQKLNLRQDWPNYYWQLEGSRNREVNYRPQLTLGAKNIQLGKNNLAANLRTGRIYEEDTDQEAHRNSLELDVNRDFAVTETTTLRTNEKVIASQYSTGDSYQSYDVNLNLKQKLPGADLGISYQYYDEAGNTPFNFDHVLNDGFGSRYTVGGTLSNNQVKLTDRLQANWKVFRNRTFYESGHVFGQYGGNAGASYQADKYSKFDLNYDYKVLTGRPPGLEIDREADNLEEVADEIKFVQEGDLELSNELTGSYSYQTKQNDWPYWKLKLTAGYDFSADEMSTIKYSAAREYDCFSMNFNVDQLEKSFDWSLNFKY